MPDDDHHPRPKRSPLSAIPFLIVAVGLFGVAAAIYYATGEYRAISGEQTAALNAQNALLKRQEQRKEYDTKLAAYARVTEAAAKIAALKSSGANASQLQEPIGQFRTLVWGPEPLTAGPDVTAALAIFNAALDANADAPQLQELSTDLANLCASDAQASLPPSSGARQPDAAAILAKMNETIRAPESQHAANQWLALVDSGDYAGSWKTASENFQASVPQDQWERRVGGLRNALGAVESRKSKSADFSAANGGHMVLQYDTSFAQKSGAVEIVTTTCDKDGAWKVSAYSVR